MRASVDDGEDGSAAAVVREAVRDWMTARMDVAQLLDLIREGLSSGEPIPAEEVFAELRARYAPTS